jgi:hypothetical protein
MFQRENAWGAVAMVIAVQNSAVIGNVIPAPESVLRRRTQSVMRIAIIVLHEILLSVMRSLINVPLARRMMYARNSIRETLTIARIINASNTILARSSVIIAGPDVLRALAMLNAGCIIIVSVEITSAMKELARIIISDNGSLMKAKYLIAKATRFRIVPSKIRCGHISNLTLLCIRLS